ncbi:MAG: hypothetical protein IH795_07125, partial [Bacteroidetes bacterium]|nr:hypothetical protein [Bacteroidota bacterium]
HLHDGGPGGLWKNLGNFIAPYDITSNLLNCDYIYLTTSDDINSPTSISSIDDIPNDSDSTEELAGEDIDALPLYISPYFIGFSFFIFYKLNKRK